MGTNELVKLGQDVALVLVQAQAMGEVGVVASLQMALDELLSRLADEREGLDSESLGPEEGGRL